MAGLRSAQSKGPPRWALAALLALFTLPPFLARALGSPIGDFAMFSRIGRYHLELSIVTAEVETEVPVRELKPHLLRDARLIILPAASNGFGQDQTDLLEAGGTGADSHACWIGKHAANRRQQHDDEAQNFPRRIKLRELITSYLADIIHRFGQNCSPTLK